jgi:type III restriction enzyme
MELRYPGGEVPQFLRPGEAIGDVDAPFAIQRQMIRRTIKEHLDKEKRLRPLGVKVLSLFFIDSGGALSSSYDADGNRGQRRLRPDLRGGIPARPEHPDYQSLFKEVDLATAAEEVHDGYFSIDKKGGRSRLDTERGSRTVGAETTPSVPTT